MSLPTWVKPQLAALVKKAPDGPDWLHEIKLDGYRMHARLDAGRVKIITRRGNDWTQKYPAIAIAGLPAQNAYLDGELCGVLPNGRTAFNLIQNAGGVDGAPPSPLNITSFPLPECDLAHIVQQNSGVKGLCYRIIGARADPRQRKEPRQ